MQSVDVLLQTVHEFLRQAAVFLPRLVLALVVITVGWLLAKFCRYAVDKALRAINFHILTERAGTDHFLQQAGARGDTTALFGLLTFWVVLLAALIMAFNGLQLNYITDLLGRVLLFAPRLLAAMLIIIFGAYCARYVDTAVRRYCVEARIPDADVLGKIVRYLILIFVVMVALSQIEVGGDIIQLIFLILLAGIVLALALAFGIGGKDRAAALLERWWPRRDRDRDGDDTGRP